MEDFVDKPFLNYDGRDAGREFRTWLKENSTTFKGYNFEGSGITAITDILGQHLMQDAYIANMTYNESSILRSKIWANKASISSARGYTPHKKIGSRIKCDIKINSDEIVDMKYRNYIFLGHKNNTSYPFVLLDNHTSTKHSDSKQQFNGIELVQGTWENFSFDVTDPGFTRFTIDEDDIDISTLNVYVYENRTSKIGIKYKRITHISDINSHGYALILDSSNKYSLVFGDDKIANRPKIGSRIFIDYVKTNGDECNDINSISITTKIENKVVESIKSKYNSFGGSDIESMQSIELNSMINSAFVDSKTYYANVIKTSFPQITDIIVIDGEDLPDKRYGIVYVYATIGNEDIIPELQEEIKLELKKYQLNPSIFVIDNPKFLSIDINIDVEYSSNNLVSQTSLRTSITESILEYRDKHYGQITSSFYPTDLIHHVLSNHSDVRILDSHYNYRINLPIGNPGINANYNLEVPSSINVSKVSFREIELDVKHGQYVNGIQFHPTTNIVTFDNMNRTETDYIDVMTDDDASYIEKDSYWVPVINDINITFNESLVGV